MLKNRLFLLLILLVQSGLIFAERSGGYCYPAATVNGDRIIELRPYAYFETRAENTNWTRILLRAWILKQDIYEEIQVKTKAKLYDEDWKLIGKAVMSFNPMRTIDENDSACYVSISAYIENGCIDPESVPELDLQKILLAMSINAKLDTFEPHIKKFKYKFIPEDNNYTSYLVNEPEFVTQGERPRILMIFFKNELIGIFHTRPLKVRIYDSIEMGSQYKMIYNSKFAEHTKKEMMRIYKAKLEKYN